MTSAGRSSTETTLAEIGASLAARPYARRGVPMSTETIRLILVDDHAIVREGLRLLLAKAPDMTVIGEADSGNAALVLAQRLRPDIVVLDLDMPDSDGSIALKGITERLPDVRVLVLTMHAEDKRLLSVLEAGARGYITKDAAANDLIDAIRVVAAGDIYVRPTTARLLAAAIVPQNVASTARDQLRSLSEREQTILKMVAEGFSGAEIARELHLSTKTVAAYKRRVQEKLGVAHRTDYVRFAVEAGLLGP